jgi:hypothetical protein
MIPLGEQGNLIIGSIQSQTENGERGAYQGKVSEDGLMKKTYQMAQKRF